MTFMQALQSLDGGRELWRAAWSDDATLDDFHYPLRVDKHDLLMCRWANRTFPPTLTRADYAAEDWEVRDAG
jgi:hypothetical protein